MDYLTIGLLVIAALYFYNRYRKRKNDDDSDNDSKTINYDNAYKQKWLLSLNEKEAYRKLKSITNELNLTLFTKVRLLDLIEPSDNAQNKKAAFWKIQAKHVDFVICDSRLVARVIIELDDNSHKQKATVSRDIFVNTILTNCGYKVIRISAVNYDYIKSELSNI